MTERKTEFWWASIAGADPEPVEKTEHEGRPCVYTCGCADPFYLGDPDNPVRLAGVRSVPGTNDLRLDFKAEEPMVRPTLPDRTEAAQIAAHYHPRPLVVGHSWRGPR